MWVGDWIGQNVVLTTKATERISTVIQTTFEKIKYEQQILKSRLLNLSFLNQVAVKV